MAPDKSQRSIRTNRLRYRQKENKIFSKKKLRPPPEFVNPQLAQLVKKVPQGIDWVHEIKFDGYRTLCRINGDDIRFLTRNGHDWSSKYKKLIETAKRLKVDSDIQNAILDGEVIWIDEKGQIDFQKLQNAISENKSDQLIYYIFDLLFLDGEDLRKRPLLERKALLEKLLHNQQKSLFRYSEHWHNSGEDLFKASCKLNLEGIVSKNSAAPYVSGRSGIWRKTKCSLRQEFVIGGYTTSPSNHRAFSALLLGAYDENGKNLRYIGRVGTGFSEITLNEISAKFKSLAIDKSPFSINSPHDSSIRWLKPRLIAEISFKGWTSDQILRQASFEGLREDKNPKDIHIDIAEKNTDDLKVTHPKRIVYTKTGTTKLNVFQYYQSVSDLMFPFVIDRPVSILRCQQTTSTGCYYQKHSEGRNLIDIDNKPIYYKDKKDSALNLKSAADILRLAQAGAIEIHSWNATFSNITKPDQIVLDLDPDNSKLWGRTVNTAFEIREMLTKLSLKSFIKVTGGKGLHIHIPILPLYSWDIVKIFSKSLMKILVEQNPEHYTINMSKTKREGRIFLDYFRNSYSATSVVPYSLRARVRPSIALPIAWRDLKSSLSPDDFIYPDALKLIKKRKDPWLEYWSIKQKIKFLDLTTIF